MSIYVLHFEAGAEVARRIAAAVGGEVTPIPAGETAETFAIRWERAEGFVFVGALAIAVRSVAPLLEDKGKDPALVVVTEDGAIALPVIAGHAGGASDLARRCAQALADRGAQFVPTVASDRAGYTAPDLWAARRGYPVLLRAGLVSVIRKLIDQGEINVWLDPILDEYRIALPLPAGYIATTRKTDADLIVSPRQVQKIKGAKPQIVPKVLAAGVGCRKDVAEASIERAIHAALLEHPKGPFLQEAVAELRTATAKEHEPGLIAAARAHNWPLVVLTDEEIIAEDDGKENFTPSAAQKHLGLPGVAEPCATSAGELLGPRAASEGVTVALSMRKPRERGSLIVVGSGPGDARFITQEARDAFAAADVVVGYKLYVDLLPPSWLKGRIVERYSMGEEEARVENAMQYAERGYHVTLVCGGDPTLFGLGALALQTALAKAGTGETVPTHIVPGITAAQAAGVATGAPYANGLALLSLSDYLQPWPDVVRAMEGAEASGLTVALYNPVKRDLGDKLAEVRRIFANRRAILVRDAGRPDESVRQLSVPELLEDAIDMRTLILFPSAKTREIERRDGEKGEKIWLEVRGYRTENANGAPPLPGSLGQFLILGGTTEGRVAAEALLSAGYAVTTSVARETGLATVPEGSGSITGARDAEDWTKLFAALKEKPLGVIDASHPFAANATRELSAACKVANIPLRRFVRPNVTPEGAIPAASPEEAAMKAIEATEPGETIFLALGVNLLSGILPPLREAGRAVVARMLPTEESMKLAVEAGLEPREIMGLWGPGDAAFNEAIFREKNVRAAITKASGREGGVDAKAEAAKNLGIPLVVLERPQEPEGLEKAWALDRRIVAQGLALGGTCSGEHGIGLGKREFLEQEHGPEVLAVMRGLKASLDPRGILNPGKLFLN